MTGPIPVFAFVFAAYYARLHGNARKVKPPRQPGKPGPAPPIPAPVGPIRADVETKATRPDDPP